MKVGIIQFFDSMHMLPGHPKCGVPHGHTYKLEVIVEGSVVNGMVVDFDVLKSVSKEILREYDHVNLNDSFDFPSCENLAVGILGRFKAQFPDKTITIRIWEGDGKWAELTG